MSSRARRRTTRRSTGNAAEAGALQACVELRLTELVALPTTRNTRGVDIVVLNPDNGRTTTLQVKTSTQFKRSAKAWWKIGPKDLNPIAKFYVFVLFPKDGGGPLFHVVPSTMMAEMSKAWWKRNNLRRVRNGELPRHDSNRGWRPDPSVQTLDAWSGIKRAVGCT